MLNNVQERVHTIRYMKKKRRGWERMNQNYSRLLTRKIINLGIKLKIKCEHIDRKVEIHHEIYPTTEEEVMLAIKKEQIYLVCRQCHSGLNDVEQDTRGLLYFPPLNFIHNDIKDMDSGYYALHKFPQKYILLEGKDFHANDWISSYLNVRPRIEWTYGYITMLNDY